MLLNYKGLWNAYNNQPEIADDTGITGDAYIVANNDFKTVPPPVIVDRDLGSGIKSWPTTEYIYYTGSEWDILGNDSSIIIDSNLTTSLLLMGG